LSSILLNAQSNEVCGFIKHYFDGTPVENVKLYIENSAITTTTDEAGAFCINLTNEESKLVFERKGYFGTYKIANEGNFLSIKMIKNAEQIIAIKEGLLLENIEALNDHSVKTNIPVLDSKKVVRKPSPSSTKTPSNFEYQKVVRDSLGKPITDTKVCLQITIYQGTPYGSIVYKENQSAITNFGGSIALEIGEGTSVLGLFGDIDWGKGPYYLESGLDLSASCTSFTSMGTAQLLSYPHALYAANTGDGSSSSVEKNAKSLPGSPSASGPAGTIRAAAPTIKMESAVPVEAEFRTANKRSLPYSVPTGPTGAIGPTVNHGTSATVSPPRATGPAGPERVTTSRKASRPSVKSSKADAADYYVGDKEKRSSGAPREILEDETKQEKIKAGRLTAGEIVDATVTLNIGNEIVWTAKTDNTGKAELWNYLFENGQATKKEPTNLKATINYKGVENKLLQLKRFEEGVNIITFKQDCNYAKNVDIAFVVDATGSMGDEIDYLKVELLDVIDRVQTKFEDLNIRLGNVFYRDKTDAYLTKNSPLTNKVKAGVAFIKDQKAGGGGDFPEAVDKGLKEAVNELKWSNEAVARILFLVLDAPPHQNEEVNKTLQQTINQAAQKGIRIVPIVGSGIDKSTEYLLRSCALATNGHYIFLTDHSGIGGSHLKPSTDSYDVKNLNDLLVDIVSRYVQVPDCNIKDEQTVISPEPNAKVKISPNPNDGRFLIESTNDLKELFITDANGKILIRFTDFITGQNQVDIAYFPTGTYYVRYEQDGKVVSQKVVKR